MRANSFGKKAAVIGASGAIGHAFLQELLKKGYEHVDAFSRSSFSGRSSTWLNSIDTRNPGPGIVLNNFKIDVTDESSISQAIKLAENYDSAPYDLIFVATGILHQEEENITPEKSLKAVNLAQLQTVFTANTFGPILIAKHFIPRLSKAEKAVFAALGARVGSIEDNHLGGWYSYRASKAALNMLLKTLSIETRRTHPAAIVVSLHPGTVASHLSSPFQARVPEDKLFTPTMSAEYLFKVLQKLEVKDTGKIFAWDGSEIKP